MAPKNKTGIFIEICPELKKQIEIYAVKKNIRMNFFIEKLLKDFFKEQIDEYPAHERQVHLWPEKNNNK